MPLLS